MTTLERLKALSEHAVAPNEPYIVIPKDELDKLLALAEAAGNVSDEIEQRLIGRSGTAAADELIEAVKALREQETPK